MSVVAERVADDAVAPSRGVLARLWAERHRLGPTLLAVVNAIVFGLVAPDVNDIFAAVARESAVQHGVGLKYWFGWYGGGATPGSYSLITPYLSAGIGAVWVAAIATAAITPFAQVALRGTRHAEAGLWLATLTAGLNLWSGRVPFAVGCLFAVVAVVLLLARRTWWAAGSAVLSVAASPVSGAFLLVGLGAVFLSVPERRRAVARLGLPIVVALIAVAAAFGQPGPEGFPLLSVAQMLTGLFLFLLARPPDWLRTTIWLTALLVPVVAFVPNGMGDNLVRLVTYCLPAVVVATAGTRLRRALLAVVVALSLSSKQSVGDVLDGAQRTASPNYYASLIHELAQRRDELSGCRLEVVEDGTHTASFALLEPAMLARGYEYQEDNALNAVLTRADLDATSYKIWLQDNAVCFVAISQTQRKATPEYRLVSARPAYLHRVWNDDKWTLYRVAHPNPIVAPPVRIVRFSQSELVVSVPCACSFVIRVRNPDNLRAITPADTAGAPPVQARLRPDAFGWTRMTTTRPGLYTLTGTI